MQWCSNALIFDQRASRVSTPRSCCRVSAASGSARPEFLTQPPDTKNEGPPDSAYTRCSCSPAYVSATPQTVPQLRDRWSVGENWRSACTNQYNLAIHTPAIETHRRQERSVEALHIAFSRLVFFTTAYPKNTIFGHDRRIRTILVILGRGSCNRCFVGLGASFACASRRLHTLRNARGMSGTRELLRWPLGRP